ncbi:hypothetical protein [Pseudomonas duriflava]
MQSMLAGLGYSETHQAIKEAYREAFLAFQRSLSRSL